MNSGAPNHASARISSAIVTKAKAYFEVGKEEET
jgi:hypothetical protein